MGNFPTGRLGSNTSYRKNHSMYNLTLEYVCQDWSCSVADACAVVQMHMEDMTAYLVK